MIRVIRIIGTATILAALFRFSQDLGRRWGHEPADGYNVAVGVVALLFFLRAAVGEFLTDKVPEGQRDILWGLSAGALLTLLARLTA